MAKGALRSKKRFGGGVLEPSHFVEISYRDHSESAPDRLHLLGEATLINGFEGLRTDFERLQLALYFLKVIHKLSQEGVVDDREIFDILGNSLTALETTKNSAELKLLFELKLLVHQGVIHTSGFERLSQTPIAEHATLGQWSREEFSRKGLEVHQVLQSYLGGIEPPSR